MAEHKKLSMLVKLDDGQTYTLGGDGADNAVTLDTEQTITGLKTFDKLPQSSAKPANDHDLVNKVYVDALKPKLKTTVMLNVESESTSWAAFNSIKFSTTTGKFIEPVYLEDTVTSTAVEPLKFVFKLADSFTGNATAKNKDFFKDYQLQDGEYFGSFTPSHLLEARWSTHTSNQQANPFSNYLAYLTTGPNSVLPFLEYQFDGLSDELKQVAFTIGDIYNSNGYPPVKFQFVVSTGAKEFTSKVYTKDADGIGRGSSHTVEFKLKALEYVTLDTKQEIAGSKTFTQNIKVSAKPKADTDVATVGYVSGLLNAKAPYDVTLDFKVEDDTDGGWVVYSNMEINLDNGKKLKCIHIDNTQPTSANAPVKAVFKAIPATEAINAAPTEQAPTFFDTYQLQDEEYLGTLTYGHILNSQLQDYASYKGPFHTNQYGTTCTIKEATQLRITISELPAAVSKVSLKFDSSYLPKTFKASLSGVGMDVTSNVLTNPSGNTPLELLFDVVKLTGLVTLDTAQTITGAKTFEVLPKSSGSLPTNYYELVNKGYVDALVKNAQLIRLYLKADYDGTASNPCFCGYHDLRMTLANGKHLVPLYLDQTYPADTNKPVQCVFKVADTAYTAHSVQLQAPEWFKSYQLKKDEVHGWVSYANILNADKVVTDHTYHTQDKPFDNYLVKEFGATKLSPALALELIGLSSPVKTISLVTGDTQNSGSYIPSEIKAECLLNFRTYVSKTFTKDADSITNNTPISISFDAIEEDNESPNFVTLNTQQELTALKTFKVLPQSEAVPADDKDLVNKKYVDEKVGAGGGTGGAAPANMVTTDTAQNITEVKTFDKLPKSSVEPTDDTELVNKKYVDDASKKVVTLADAQTISGVKTFSALPQSSVEPATDTDLVNKKYVDAKVGGGGAAGGNVMTLNTEQTVTAVKQFDKFPRLSDNYAYILPTDPKEFVNKAYVDNATTVNNGYALNIYGTLEASGKKIFISNMEITLQNGEKLVLRYSASDAKPGQSASTRVLWSYGDTGKTYGSLESLDGSRIGSYQCNSQEIKGYIKTGGQLRVENKYNFSPAEMIFTGTSTDEHQLVSFEFEGSFPPIARVAFRSSTGDLKGKSLRFESIVKGHNKGAEYPIQNVAENNQYNLPINPAFVPEPYYLNRFDEQYIQGIYHYQVMPMLDKPVAMFSKANANTPAAMGDFLQSIAIPVPKTQVLVFENRATKTNIGAKPPYRYQWDINLQIGDLKLTRKRPSDLQEEELFLKFCGPSADGYKGVLTTKKPENYLNPVVEKQQHEMDAYKLEAGECWCKLAYNTQRGGMFSDENLAYNEKQGSNKLKDLFLPKSVWFNASETEYNWNENGGPKADVRLLIFDSAMISWTVQKEGCSNNYQSLELRGDRTKKNYSEYLLKQNPQPVFVHDVPDLQLQTTNVLAIIQALQDRVKALEDAAPKP